LKRSREEKELGLRFIGEGPERVLRTPNDMDAAETGEAGDGMKNCSGADGETHVGE